MGEQKLQNSLNFSAGESQNKAQMRRAELSTRRRRERERERGNGRRGERGRGNKCSCGISNRLGAIGKIGIVGYL